MTEERKREIEEELNGLHEMKVLMEYGSLCSLDMKNYIFSLLDTELTKQREVIKEFFKLRVTGMFGEIMQETHTLNQVVGEDYYVTLQQLEHYINTEVEKVNKLPGLQPNQPQQ